MSEKIKEQPKADKVDWRQIEEEVDALSDKDLELFKKYEEIWLAAWRQVSEKREKILEEAAELLRSRFGNGWKQYLGMWRSKQGEKL
ncbi:hypothetical protein MYX06_02770 [Patescibacteria group bacterium AH-259-L05]|nr:hypothetical protein [Patescibacteria group bacterium AH-259-L05]